MSKKLHNKKKIEGRRQSLVEFSSRSALFWVGKGRLVVVVVSSFRDDGARETDRRRMSHNCEGETRREKLLRGEKQPRERESSECGSNLSAVSPSPSLSASSTFGFPQSKPREW